MRNIREKLRIFLLILILTLVSGGSLVSAEELPSPAIAVNPDIYYSDEILYMEGNAKPNATVQIQFQQSGSKPFNLNVKSDARGEWVLAQKVPLEAGNWEVRARIVSSSGETSSWSNPRVIKVIATGFNIGGFTVKFTFLILLFAGGVLVIVYLLWRLKREVRQSAVSHIGQDFSDLRRDVVEELKHLERKRSLSREEAEHRDKLLRDLEHIEKEIESKVKDI